MYQRALEGRSTKRRIPANIAKHDLEIQVEYVSDEPVIQEITVTRAEPVSSDNINNDLLASANLRQL